jgi:hypothetical protein
MLEEWPKGEDGKGNLAGGLLKERYREIWVPRKVI